MALTPHVLVPYPCDGGCGEEIGGRAIVIDRRALCDLCASQEALELLDKPTATPYERNVSKIVLAIVEARRLARIDANRRAIRVAPPIPVLPVLNRQMCLACAREGCAAAGFKAIEPTQSGHVCGKEN